MANKNPGWEEAGQITKDWKQKNIYYHAGK